MRVQMVEGSVDDIFRYFADRGSDEYALTLCAKSAAGSEIPDYGRADKVPWHVLAQIVVSISFDGNITSIGDYAFRDCGFFQTSFEF